MFDLIKALHPEAKISSDGKIIIDFGDEVYYIVPFEGEIWSVMQIDAYDQQWVELAHKVTKEHALRTLSDHTYCYALPNET